MVARELPSDEVLASWQHIDQRARDLRSAGLPGTLQELRVRAYLDLLQERDSRTSPVAPGPRAAAAPDAPDCRGRAVNPDAAGVREAYARPHSPDGDDAPEGPDTAEDPGGPGSGGPGGPAARPPGTGRTGTWSTCPSSPEAGPSLAALVTITVPWSTLVGLSETPGEADGFGMADAQRARDLAAAAARHPRTQRRPKLRPARPRPRPAWTRRPACSGVPAHPGHHC